jgi:hypothetical protein
MAITTEHKHTRHQLNVTTMSPVLGKYCAESGSRTSTVAHAYLDVHMASISLADTQYEVVYVGIPL